MEQWKGGNELFDVTMGSFYGAEVCELVGLYLLDKLSKLLGKNNVGLYRDDGLAAVKSTSGPVLDKMRKNIITLFKNEGLGITIDTNLIKTDSLDVTFNLTTGKFFPYRKPNNIPLYIKFRYNNHTKSFRNRGYEHETEHSKHIWELKDNNTEFYLEWSIAAYVSPYRCGTRRCDLCLTEKYIIARAEQKNLLNKRAELISKCRHRNKYILKNL